MEYKHDSYCGIYCGACFIMRAFRQNRQDCLPNTWVSSIHDKDLTCYGCKSDKLFVNCQGCHIRQCAISNGVEYCNLCNFYPCEKFEHLDSLHLSHHNVAVDYLKRIQLDGKENYMKEQEVRWKCSECGYGFSWYETHCHNCHAEVYDIKKEENELKKAGKI